MRKLFMWIITTLLLATSSFAVVVTTIEQLDDLAEFSFSAFGDNNGYAKSNYDSGDNNAKGMARLEPWVKANDKFIVGVGDHAIGSRKNWYQMNESDSFFHNHYYPSLGDNCNGTDYFYGVTGDQAVWGRGWVMFKALDNFFTRNTAIDQITFRPKGAAKVYSSKSKAEPNVLVPYDDQLCDYYAKRTQGAFTFHIISVNCPDPGVLASVSKNFLISKLNTLAATKTSHDVIIVMAQKANWVQRAEDSKWISRAERDTIMTVADLVLCGDDHIYRRQSNFDGQYDGTEALWMNVGQPCASTGSGRGYLNFHMFDNPPRFTVQYIMNEVESTRKLHVAARQIGTLQKSLPAAHTKPYLKYINGRFESVDWNNFTVSTTPVTQTNGASFVSQVVPSTLVAGKTTNVTVRVKNTGTLAWSGSYYLGSQNPQDNSTWGMNRVKLPAGVTVAAGQEYSFSFVITAPVNIGTYNFQWKMIDGEAPNLGWFGALTANKSIVVTAGSLVTVPWVTNLTESAAGTSITNAGLVVSSVSREYHATVAAGKVFSQTPGGGTSVARGSSVAMAVSLGPQTVPSVGSIITLKAVNGQYVSATYSTNNTLIANKTTLTNYERFKVVNATNSVALQCMGNSKFVSIDALNGSKPMVANRSSIGSYEKFQLVQSGSQIAIKSVTSTNYVSAISGGAAPLQANQTYIGSYEKFTWKVE